MQLFGSLSGANLPFFRRLRQFRARVLRRNGQKKRRIAGIERGTAPGSAPGRESGVCVHRTPQRRKFAIAETEPGRNSRTNLQAVAVLAAMGEQSKISAKSIII